MSSRSEASKKAWRTRRRKKAYRAAKCPYCGKPVWVRGIERQGKIWHANCYERHVFKVPR